MRTLIGLLAIATLAASQSANNPKSANPQRFMANDVRPDGDITHLRGNVMMKQASASIDVLPLNQSVRITAIPENWSATRRDAE